MEEKDPGTRLVLVIDGIRSLGRSVEELADAMAETGLTPGQAWQMRAEVAARMLELVLFQQGFSKADCRDESWSAHAKTCCVQAVMLADLLLVEVGRWQWTERVSD